MLEKIFTPETEIKLHNPDHLTDEQVGTDKGWRLLRVEELNTLDAFPKNDETIEEWNGEAWDLMSTLVHDSESTYRTRRASK